MIIHNSSEAIVGSNTASMVNQNYGKPSFTIDDQLFTAVAVKVQPLTNYKNPNLHFGVDIEVDMVTHFRNGKVKKGAYDYGTYLSCNQSRAATEFFNRSDARKSKGMAGCEHVNRFCRRIIVDVVGL